MREMNLDDRTTERLRMPIRPASRIDLVLEDRAGDITCVEIKAAATIVARDWRWLARLRHSRRSSFRAGVIVAAVAQIMPLGDRLWAVPYSALWI